MRLLRAAARTAGWTADGWRPFLLLFATGAAAIYLAISVSNRQIDVTRFWSAYLAGYSLFLLATWTLTARRRLVVHQFSCYGKSAADIQVEGIATLLAMELVRLHRLYVAVEEEGEVPSAAPATTSMQATIGADQVGAVLQSAVSAESTFDLGPFKVPAGAVMAVVARIVQGPRITGALFADPGRLELTAQLVSDRDSRVWRAVAEGEGREVGWALIEELVAALAVQVFADIALARAVRWQAVRAFSQGLQEYRQCLPEPAKEPLRLQRAADRFIEAIADYGEFDLAYYNFGVVMLARRQFEAAESAFFKAIRSNPSAPQAYYALAQHRFVTNSGDASVATLCDRVIELKPNHRTCAQAYDLKALSETVIGSTEPIEPELLRQAIHDANRAAIHSMLALVGAELTVSRAKSGAAQIMRRIEVVTASCYSTLAYAHSTLAATFRSRLRIWNRLRIWFECWKGVRAVAVAADVNAANPHLFRQLAHIYDQQGRPKAAASAMLRAARITGADPDFWAEAAYLCAQSGDIRNAMLAASTVVRQPSVVSIEHLVTLYRALVMLDLKDDADRARDIWRLRQLHLELWRPPARLAALVKRADHYRSIRDTWREGFLKFLIAQLQAEPGDAAAYTLAAATAKESIAALDMSYPGETSRIGVRAVRAQWLGYLQLLPEALADIEYARRVDPLSSWEGETYARICMELEEWEKGVQAWRTLLAQEAATANRYTQLAWCLIQIAQNEADRARRRDLHFEAERHLSWAIELAEPQERGAAHYLLGYALRLRGDDERGLPHLQVAKALPYALPLTLGELTNICLFAKRFDQCVAYAEDLLKNVSATLAGGWSPTERLYPECINPAYPHQLLALAYNAKAYAAAEKGVALTASLKWVTQAKAHAAQIPDEGLKESMLSAIWDTQACIVVRQGKIDEAIDLFERSLAIEADPQAYWHLAVAYEKKSVQPADVLTRLSIVNAATDACQLVIDLDPWQIYSPRATELKARLARRMAAMEAVLAALPHTAAADGGVVAEAHAPT